VLAAGRVAGTATSAAAPSAAAGAGQVLLSRLHRLAEHLLIVLLARNTNGHNTPPRDLWLAFKVRD
jgi:hypothetical protein